MGFNFAPELTYITYTALQNATIFYQNDSRYCWHPTFDITVQEPLGTCPFQLPTGPLDIPKDGVGDGKGPSFGFSIPFPLLPPDFPTATITGLTFETIPAADWSIEIDEENTDHSSQLIIKTVPGQDVVPAEMGMGRGNFTLTNAAIRHDTNCHYPIQPIHLWEPSCFETTKVACVMGFLNLWVGDVKICAPAGTIGAGNVVGSVE